jgi:hypothetical protein
LHLEANRCLIEPMQNGSQQHDLGKPVATFSGIHCALEIYQPHEGIVVIVLKGTDTGEMGDGPFRELAPLLEQGAPVEIFVDAREVPSASIDVSGVWARWMRENRERIYRLNMLCKSRFIELTAKFVQRFTEFGARMRIYTDSIAFDEALRTGCGQTRGARELG